MSLEGCCLSSLKSHGDCLWQETGNLQINQTHQKRKVGAGGDKGSRELGNGPSHLMRCTKHRANPKEKLFPGTMDMNVTGIRQERLLKANRVQLNWLPSEEISSFVDQGESVVASCFDLIKAFNTVFHSILGVKLRRYRLSGWTKKLPAPWGSKSCGQ